MFSPRQLNRMHIGVSKKRILAAGAITTTGTDRVSKIVILTDCVFSELRDEWCSGLEAEQRSLQGLTLKAPNERVGNFTEVILTSGACMCYLWPDNTGAMKGTPAT